MIYRGRFAPTPNGLLHRGSLVAALASWLDARAHRGQWLLRFDDLDVTRCQPDAPQAMLQQLSWFGLVPDQAPVKQSARLHRYQQAFDDLSLRQRTYPCACSRRDIDLETPPPGVLQGVYPGTCRLGLRGRVPRAWRARVTEHAPAIWHWSDRRLGPQSQQIALEVGDFVLLRADGVWAYQLATVVDDADMGITHVVRGEDLADSTPRQMWLAQELGFAPPAYLHTPLRRDAQGQKLGKSTGAEPLWGLTADAVVSELQQACVVLGLPIGPVSPIGRLGRIGGIAPNQSRADLLAQALNAWRAAWP